MNEPRLALIKDMPRVLELIQELATYEKEADAVEITTSDLENDGFGSNPKFICFVCEVENKIEGIALVYPRYSTWKGEILHLEDLIVSEKCRGKGIGTQLLDVVVKYGHQRGVKRISWDVLDWNEPAINFYESKGADVKRDWNVVHLNEQGIKNYLNQL
ncbi:GNAT family N-acetyltransferase [Winogradskyella helgolandensis]|uniref:GNAT family N-acetyltransferase n=1 Tax=Winogradskyella helgolandensis TaxID=2697010 RepID=UPI0015BD882D|nr:GNAT family N-acetyltransferase [Winogradskyella helgolandensis]